MRDRLRDELVELRGRDHAAGDQRRDALDRGEEDEADAVGLAGNRRAWTATPAAPPVPWSIVSRRG
jgi:hypothetical protein